MTTLALQPDATAGKDAPLNKYSANNNYGTDPKDFTKVGRVNSTITYRFLFQFDLSSIASGSTISIVTFQAYTDGDTGSINTDCTVSAYPILRAWGEGARSNAAAQTGECSWNSARATVENWATAGCDNTTSDRESSSMASASLADGTGSGWVSWSMTTSKVSEWVNGTLTNNGFILINSVESTYRSDYRFYSSDYATDTSLRPKLTIEYTAGSTTAPVHLLRHRSIGLDL